MKHKYDYHCLNLPKRFQNSKEHHSEISSTHYVSHPELLPQRFSKNFAVNPGIRVVSAGLTSPSGNCSVELSMDA